MVLVFFSFNSVIYIVLSTTRITNNPFSIFFKQNPVLALYAPIHTCNAWAMYAIEEYFSIIYHRAHFLNTDSTGNLQFSW